MEEFSPFILNDLICHDYKYLLYRNLDHFALLIPLRGECAFDEDTYLVPIDDEQAWDMANGVDGFLFYVMDVN